MAKKRLFSQSLCLIIITVCPYVWCGYVQQEAREGDNVTLQCRFELNSDLRKSPINVWRKVRNSQPAAIFVGDIPLDTNYQILKAEGRFDLLIINVTYERDNGQFECWVRAGGTEQTIHSQEYNLVVLRPPKHPMLNTGPKVLAREGRQLNLTCSSIGGIPSPDIKWYRDGSIHALNTEMIIAKTPKDVTTAILTLEPSHEDNGASFRCDVWNRAMGEGQRLEATVELTVYYSPRVQVGPENPLRIEINKTANMTCRVDCNPQVSYVRWSRDGNFVASSFNFTIKGVTVEDAGKYICSADNGIDDAGENEIYLDVLYPPRVVLSHVFYEAEEGDSVKILCQVESNPNPMSIEWTMKERNDFLQKGNILLLTRVDASMMGIYICRAVNVMSASGGKKEERAGIASVFVIVRHKPGKSYINPEHPIAQEGKRITFTCSSKPPGWPVPKYRWSSKTKVGERGPKVFIAGNKYTIPSAHLDYEGVYQCQAVNELGFSETATANLEVHQPPRFQYKLHPYIIKRSGERNFSITCAARGKPFPRVKWYKNNTEIRHDDNSLKVQTEFNTSGNAVVNVQSILWFQGKARPNTNDLLLTDNSIYICMFENDVGKIESSTYLRFEHGPISVKYHKQVAVDLEETTKISCRIQAYPKPEFQWFYGTNDAPLSSNVRYKITTTTKENDTYLSKLMIQNVTTEDYGLYYCKVKNALGNIRLQIQLQPKGAPEPPKNLVSQRFNETFVTLKWESGFDGGLTTKYIVWLRQVRNLAYGENCIAIETNVSYWKEYDCGYYNNCNLTHLDQNNSYHFKVKAVNKKGESDFSEVVTEVINILPPENVTYDTATRMISFSVGAACFLRKAMIEQLKDSDKEWQVIHVITLTQAAADLEVPVGMQDRIVHFRVKVCNKMICSKYIKTKDDSNTTTASTLYARVIIGIACSIFAAIIFFYLIRYIIKKIPNDEPPMGSHQNQQSENYALSNVTENKALENSTKESLITLSTSMKNFNNIVTQGDNSYYTAHPGPIMLDTDQQTNSSDGEDSSKKYTVTAIVHNEPQNLRMKTDSLRQTKMTADNNFSGFSSHHVVDGQSNEYDPTAKCDYIAIDDYTSYSPLPHGALVPDPDDGMQNSEYYSLKKTLGRTHL